MECKGLGLALRETLSGRKNELSNWLTWFCLFSLIVCVTVQINYLNKALDTFNTSVVTPVYYVFFTTFVICASVILFQEWRSMAPDAIVGSICGFLTVICAIFLLNAFREWDISLSNLSNIIQQRRASSMNGSVNDSNIETSIIIDHRSRDHDERTILLDRHSRQNSLETRSFNTMLSTSEGTYNSLLYASK